MNIKNLKKITDYIWEIPKIDGSDMRVPARIFVSEKMLTEIFQDRSLEQLINVTTLPGIRKAAFAMPDIHEGYGFPVGGVAATSFPDGVISPGGIGYDINCGIRLLKSTFTFKELKPHFDLLSRELYKEIPSGVGKGGALKMGLEKLDIVLNEGVLGLIKEGYGEEDISCIESRGCLQEADVTKVSEASKQRGKNQLGTIGGGNHFIEIDRVDEIYDEDTAKVFGLFPNQIVILIHTGSRGLGHQVATDYIKLIMQVMEKYNVVIADRELAAAPLSSPEGRDYFAAMSAAANFAWCNRQMISWEVQKVWKTVLGNTNKLKLLYDVAHNIARIETHFANDSEEKLIVHRKGATRSFGPNNTEIPDIYLQTGQPVIIPGSMGTQSFVLVGTNDAMFESFGSCCHGAGRKMSRHKAKKQMQGKEILEKLKSAGIHILTDSVIDLSEEAPFAYKDVSEVVDIVDKVGLARKVAGLKPVVVIKG